MKKYLLTGWLALLVQIAFAGGPWPQPQGVGYFKLSEWWIVFDRHYTDAGNTDPNVTTGIFNTFLYAEYGITDRLTGVFNGAIFSRNYMNNLRSQTTGEILVPGEALNSLGDLDIGVKYGLTRPGARIPVSASVILGIPSGTPAGGSQGNLATGDGEFNQMIRIDAGFGFQISSDISSYFSAYTGFNHRTRGFSEEIRYGVEYGIGFFNQRAWLIGRFFGIESLRNGDTAETTTSTSIFANNTEFTSYSLEVNVYLTRCLGVSANFASAFRGEIIAAAPTYSVGVFWDLSR